MGPFTFIVMATARATTQVAAVISELNELSRAGVDVGTESTIMSRVRKTKKRLGPRSVFAYGSTQSWVLLSGAGNLDLGSLELVLTIQPRYTSGSTVRRNCNTANDFRLARAATNAISIYGSDLNGEATANQTSLICLYNVWAMLREIEVLIGGRSLKRFTGTTIQLALRKCLDRLINSTQTGAPVVEFLPIESHLFSASDVRSKLTVNRLTGTDAFEIRIPLEDGLMLKPGSFWGGRGVLTINVTWETEDNMQKAFMQNPATPNPTNGIRIQPEITAQRVEYDVIDRNSELSVRLFSQNNLLGGLPRAYNVLHTLISSESGAQTAKIFQSNAVLRGVAILPFLDPSSPAVPAVGDRKVIRYGRYVSVTNWDYFRVSLGSQTYDLTTNADDTINFRAGFTSSTVKSSYENWVQFTSATTRRDTAYLTQEAYLQNTPVPCIWFDKLPVSVYVGNHQYSQVEVSWEPESALPANVKLIVLALFQSTYRLSLEGALSYGGNLSPIGLGELPAFVANQIAASQPRSLPPGANSTA